MEIVFNNRFYELTRSYAIKNWQDSLIELITNSSDSYIKQGSESKDIEITLKNNREKLCIFDHGIGMTTKEAVFNLLNVGNSLNSDSDVRGYFNRGAKDVTALGDVSFICLKDGECSRVTIKHNLDVLSDIITDVKYISDIFGVYKTGVYVELSLLKVYRINETLDLPSISNMISSLFQLRSIMSSGYNITLIEGDKKENVKFVHKPSSLVDSIDYKVPGYTHITASYQLYMTEEILPDILNRRMQQHGVLIKSSRTDYDMTLFNEINNTHYAKYFYGFVVTEGISKMLKDYETLGPTDKNPQLILNPNRGGINVDHPFIKQLYSIPSLMFKTMVEAREMDSLSSNVKTNSHSLELNNLENIANSIIKRSVPNYFIHKERVTNLALAVKDIQNNYIITNKLHELDDIEVRDENIYNVPYTEIPIQKLYSKEPVIKDDSFIDVSYGDISNEQGFSSLDRVVYAEKTKECVVKLNFIEFSKEKDKMYNTVVGNNIIYIYINTLHPIIKGEFIFDDNGDLAKISNTKGSVILSDIISDSISWLYTEKKSGENDERDYTIKEGLLHCKDIYNNKKNELMIKLVDSFNT